MFILVIIAFAVNVNAQWVYSYAEAVELAKVTGKPMMLDFTASWCGPCKKMDADVWPAEEVKSNMGKMVMAKIDIDIDRSAAAKFGIQSIPNIVIALPDGKVLHQEIGYQSISMIVRMLKSYDVNFSEVYAILLSKEKETDVSLIQLGNAYVDVVPELEGRSSSMIMSFAESAYKKGGKLAQKNQNTQLSDEANLRMIAMLNLKKQPEKVIAKLDKEVDISSLSPTNKVLALSARLDALIALEKSKEAMDVYNDLKSIPEASDVVKRYANRLEKM